MSRIRELENFSYYKNLIEYNQKMEKFSNSLILDNKTAAPYSGVPKDYLILDDKAVRRQRGMVARILYTPATRLTEVLPSATDILPMPCLPSSTFSL